MHHIISAEQFNTGEIIDLFHQTDEMRKESAENERELAQRYIGKQVCNLFYEPSTRTRISFDLASKKLGIGVSSTENASQFSSAIKGETLEDSVKVLDQYGFDAIIIRHPETGSAERAVGAVERAAIINAGDGQGEHPTQSLLDLYTIWSKKQTLDNLNITIGGDLARGRTAKSLAKLISKFDDNKITFVSTKKFKIDYKTKNYLDGNNTEYFETSDMSQALTDAGVVYWTRMQKERTVDTYNQNGNDPDFIIDQNALSLMQEDAIIMHPLPRVNEIDTSVDKDPRAVYFEQAGNGLFIRMAILDSIIKNQK